MYVQNNAMRIFCNINNIYVCSNMDVLKQYNTKFVAMSNRACRLNEACQITCLSQNIRMFCAP
jgi:hypothetical protein